MNLTDIKFTKLHAAGNDFICIDNTKGTYDHIVHSAKLPEFVKLLCNRRTSIGADGVVFALRPATEESCVVLAQFLEPDGSEAEICGNATMCFAFWAFENGFCHENDVLIQSKAGNARGKIVDMESGKVMVWLPDSKGLDFDVDLELEEFNWPTDYAHIGLPHSITYVDDLKNFPVAKWGPPLRHHNCFKPRGVNANFVQILDEGKLAIRTYEFGVEAETLACGTGTCCSAVTSALRFNWDDAFKQGKRPIEVLAPSGNTLKVWFNQQENGQITNVRFESIVQPVYEGIIRKELLQDTPF